MNPYESPLEPPDPPREQKRFAGQELASGTLFFAALGWLIIDAIRSVPLAAPSLWPLIPMFVATVWYIAIEHMRSRAA